MAKIKVKSAKEIELIRDAGALAAETLIRAGEMCKAGVSTLEIAEFIDNFVLDSVNWFRYHCISVVKWFVPPHGVRQDRYVLGYRSSCAT